MDKEAEYRKHAAEAQAMADRSRNADDKAAWLRIAQGWMSMIRKPRQTALEKFDENTKKKGTGQEDSNGSH
jgi:hypothetical protein